MVPEVLRVGEAGPSPGQTLERYESVVAERDRASRWEASEEEWSSDEEEAKEDMLDEEEGWERWSARCDEPSCSCRSLGGK